MTPPYRYKVLVGLHHQDLIDKDGKKVMQKVPHPEKEGQFKEIPTPVNYTPQSGAFYTLTDLSQRFDREGLPQKFQRVYEEGTPQAIKASAPPELNLEGMSLEELRKLAEEEEVDYKGLKSREDFLKRLKLYFASK